MSNSCRIGFLGAGRMASAIAGGMVKGKFNCGDLSAYDCSPAAAAAFTQSTGVECLTDPVVMMKDCHVILLAVKPQYLAEALQPLNSMLKDKLVISIVAGITLERLASLTGADRIVRVMPNTPALVLEGCGAYALSPAATAEDKSLVGDILGSIGCFYELPEKLMDAVTALSGCGPAYVYELIQAMSDGGVTLGLPRDLAQKLAAATVRGAAAMVLNTQTHPVELRDQVCSPGGATICAVNALAQEKFSHAVIAAELAAYERSVELGKN